MKRNRFVVPKVCSVGAVNLYLAAVLVFAANSAYCQEVAELPMTGKESIDPNEPISGGDVVGVNLIKAADDKNKYDLEEMYVHFNDTNIPYGSLEVTLTTVDGRYNFIAERCLPPNMPKSTEWARLALKNEKNESLHAGFLKRYFSDEDLGGVAVLVTDKNGTKFPVLWGKPPPGKPKDLDLEIRVNAEGADAFYIRYTNEDGEETARQIQCEEASKRSGFKFDQYCRMAWEDAKKLGNQPDNKDNKGVPIIRKRGATYEPSIFVKIEPRREDPRPPGVCEVPVTKPDPAT